MAPDADQEVHRHERDFPEDVEQEEVDGDEDADEAEFQKDQQRKIFFHAMLDVLPGDDDADGGQESREQDQPQAESVDPNVVVDRRDS